MYILYDKTWVLSTQFGEQYTFGIEPKYRMKRINQRLLLLVS